MRGRDEAQRNKPTSRSGVAVSAHALCMSTGNGCSESARLCQRGKREHNVLTSHPLSQRHCVSRNRRQGDKVLTQGPARINRVPVRMMETSTDIGSGPARPEKKSTLVRPGRRGEGLHKTTVRSTFQVRFLNVCVGGGWAVARGG